jgi:hypothetical protein
MIGSISLENHEDPAATAILNDDGTWECTDPVYQQLLNTQLAVVWHRPQDGWFGFKNYYEAVEFFRESIIMRLVDPASEPGAVY